MGAGQGNISAKTQRFSEAEQQQHHQDYTYAQELTSLAPPGELSVLAYPHRQCFQLKPRWWQGRGNAKIRGPGGRPWFQLTHTNYLSWSDMFKGSKFAICTMSGEPVMLLREIYHWMASYEFELLRVDPQTKKPIPVCRITRDFKRNLFTINQKYDIQLHASAGSHGVVHCSGQWPSNFRLTLNGHSAAVLDKPFFRTVWDKYAVMIEPNMDVLLFLGIACAIDRIESEMERK